MPEILETLSRGLDVLRLLEGGDELSLSTIARSLGLTQPRTHRILGTLEVAGFVIRSPETRRYRLVFGAKPPAPAAGFDEVLDTAYPILEWLRDQSGETAHLSMLSGRHIYFVASVESPHPLRVTSRVGRRVPAVRTAAGKVLLAQRPDADLDRLLAGLGDAALATRLRKELHEARRTGMARNLGESEVGMATVAVPIRLPDPDGSLLPGHALAISGPESRINPHRAPALTAIERRHLRLLAAAASQVSASLTLSPNLEQS